MRYASARGFEKALKRVSGTQQLDIRRHVDAFVRGMEARQIPAGLGLTRLAEDLWEFRSGLAIRVLITMQGGTVTFLFAGNHDEVRRFLKHFRP